MERVIRMRARVDFTHAGRVYVAGEEFETDPATSAAMRYQRWAGFAADEEPAASPPPEAPPSRRYRRRDLTAED